MVDEEVVSRRKRQGLDEVWEGGGEEWRERWVKKAPTTIPEMKREG
jgi:hypothetical protein